MNIPDWRKAIIETYSSWWVVNDKAHQQNHFEAVFQCGAHISNEMDLGYDPKLILFAAYFHDMFAYSRVNHHQLSHLWMMTTDDPLIVDHLNPEERVFVAQACEQHRASFTGKFHNQFCELFNSADREMPGDVQAMLDRAVKFREKRHPEMSEDERMAGAIEHLKEKFGHGGYARYPNLYLLCFNNELEHQRDQIMAL